jgi:predicted component of type VI protein secretion system
MPRTARLEIVAGNATGMSILVENELLIGRHAQGAGRLADDAEISRSHARVTLEESGFCAIEDLGSTNGTYVNGLRINSPATLAEGDTIELGSTTLVVRELPVDGDEAPTADAPAGNAPAGDALTGDAPRGATMASVPALSESDAPGAVLDDAPTEAQAPAGGGPADDHEPGMFIGLAPAVEELAAAGGLPGDQDEPGEQTRRGPSPLRLGFEIDFDAQEARIFLSDDGDLMRIGFAGGEWQITLPPAP